MEIKIDIVKSEFAHLVGLVEEIDNFILSESCTHKAEKQLKQLVNLTATLADKICQQSLSEMKRGDDRPGICSYFDLGYVATLGAYKIPPYNSRKNG